jgi:hypothetical protein
MEEMETSTDPLVERLAQLFAGWGLVAPAIAFLEANKPLSFVGSQALLMLQPMADLFVARELTTELAGLLANRDRLELLINRLGTVEGRKEVGSKE